MPLYEHGKTIWANAPKQGTCTRCGDQFPLEIGDTAQTCGEWACLTLTRLPKPVPVAVVLNLAQWSRFCDLAWWIKRQIAGIEGPLELD